MIFFNLFEGDFHLFVVFVAFHDMFEDFEFWIGVAQLFVFVFIIGSLLGKFGNDFMMHIFTEFIFKFCQFFFNSQFSNVFILSESIYDIGKRIFFIVKIFSEIADPIFKLLDPFIIETPVLDSNLCFKES